MKKIYQLLLLTCTLITVSISCKKIDFPHPPAAADCDYQTLISNYLYRWQEIFPDSPLFVKHYIANTQKIDFLSNRYQGFFGTYDEGQDLYVRAAGLHTYYLNAKNDTFVTLKYSAQGKLLSAKAFPDMYIDDYFLVRSDFKFNYTSGKITSINRRQSNSGIWEDYIKLEYNADYSNLSKVLFYLFGNLEAVASFNYDANKIVKHQYYADQHATFPYHFFSFLKYLNVFPELLPKNLVTGYYLHYTEPGSGDETHIYGNYKFDASGNLISYDITNSAQDFPPEPTEHWSIKWNCCQIAPKVVN